MANTVFQNILKGVSLYYIDDAVQFLNPPDCEVALCGRKGSEDFCHVYFSCADWNYLFSKVLSGHSKH